VDIPEPVFLRIQLEQINANLVLTPDGLREDRDWLTIPPSEALLIAARSA